MKPRYIAFGLEALIFDFDGTLARQTINYGVMRREALIAAERFIPLPEDAAHIPTMELLERVGTATENARRARAAALAAVKDVETAAAEKSFLFPYVRPMLAAMAERGLKAAVITRNCAEAVTRVFPDIHAHMLLFTRDDVSRVKPHPEHLEKALEALGVSPERALMVGDHPMDVAVGKSAGTLTAAVASGGHGFEELAACAPDFIGEDGGAVLRILDIL